MYHATDVNADVNVCTDADMCTCPKRFLVISRHIDD